MCIYINYLDGEEAILNFWYFSINTKITLDELFGG